MIQLFGMSSGQDGSTLKLGTGGDAARALCPLAGDSNTASVAAHSTNGVKIEILVNMLNSVSLLSTGTDYTAAERHIAVRGPGEHPVLRLGKDSGPLRSRPAKNPAGLACRTLVRIISSCLIQNILLFFCLNLS
jgi:hypothetical protein